MKLEFGNLEHLLLIWDFRIDSIYDELHHIDVEWDGLGNKEILSEERGVLEIELSNLLAECSNIRCEMYYKAVQEVIPLDSHRFEKGYPNIGFPSFIPGLVYS